MFNTNDDYTMGGLELNYLNLRKYLLKMYEKGIQDINIFLLVSLEKEYYQGENFKKIIQDFIKLSNNLVVDFDILDKSGKPTGKKTEKVKFKVNKISLDVGDTANRWRWIYRYNEKYMLEHNLINEEDIPKNIVEQIAKQSYETAKQQGKDWFKDNAVDALNLILPNDSKITKDISLTDGITEIFKGNNEISRIEYICYDYWLNDPKYKIIEKALLEVRNLENSVVEQAYDYEVKYFTERITKRGTFVEFPEMFAKYNKLYLFDETMPMIMKNQDEFNNFEFYWFGTESKYTLVFKGKKAQNNEIIKHYIGNELKGVINRNYITIKEKLWFDYSDFVQ
ncbi:MAG TPA: hypothetical protein VLL98_02000 [Rickettsiales bacterium]|nr:hypothetical protein [Rickettsiales bacterium]